VVSIEVRHNEERIIGFTIVEHCESRVCAAVSFLSQNTVNSVKVLTDEPFICDYKPEGGFLKWDREGDSPEADLLLESLLLGLRCLEESYGEEVSLVYAMA